MNANGAGQGGDAAPLAPLTPLGDDARVALLARVKAGVTLLTRRGARRVQLAPVEGGWGLTVNGDVALELDDVRRLVVDSRALADRVRQLQTAVNVYEQMWDEDTGDPLDALADEALAHHRAGRTTAIPCGDPQPHAASPARIGGADA